MNFSHELMNSLSASMSSREMSFGVNYTPIHFSGVGNGFASITTDEGLGGFLSLPLESDFQIQLLTEYTPLRFWSWSRIWTSGY